MASTTLVLGASEKQDRYSNMAVRRLLAHGHPVIAVGRRAGRIAEAEIVTTLPEHASFDTVTLYLSAANQAAWREALLRLRPRRVIFNPGAENPSFQRELEQAGCEVLEACTLVMLSTGSY
ncbi:MAG TPA: CoA-binding protein [Flavobacteriales bacterium]|nr:CoA-binding protein [Flavobacteriales bacterium]